MTKQEDKDKKVNRRQKVVDPTKKSRRSLWILAGILTVVVIVCGIFGFKYMAARSALKENETVISDFTQRLSKQSYEELGHYFNKESMADANTSADAINERYQTIFSGIEANNISVKDVKVKKNDSGQYEFSYSLAMTTSLGKLEDLTYFGTITDKLIDWKPGLLLPGMTGQDKISVSVQKGARGEITDKDGNGLAINKDFQELGVVPEELGEGDEKTGHIEEIASTYDISVDTIEKAIAQSWVQPSYFVPLKVLSDEEAKKELPEAARTQAVNQRYYPLGEAAAHLIGYVGQVTAEDLESDDELSSESVIGKSGLEASYEKKLRAQDGGTIAITDKDGNQKEVLQQIEKKDGQTIQLTIDSKAQQIAYDELDGAAGSSVVMNPTDGSLMVLTSSPSFDPNLMTNGISQEDYDKYNNDPLLPFTNRFTNRYAPGSTFKTITAAIGLDAGTIDASDVLTIDGLKWQKDSSWGNYMVTRVSDVSEVDLEKAMIYSDNIYMAQETLKMGQETFIKGLEKFIFGEKLELSFSMTPAQISNDGTLDSEILLADTGYGQGQLLISPIQQATMYTVFAQEGKLVYPKLEADAETKTKESVISKEAANRISDDLKEVVSNPNGTAHELASLNLSLAAKTGTAEIKEKQDETGQENSFLLAYNPDNKNYLMVTMLENRKEGQTATNHSVDLLKYLNQIK